MFAGRKVKNKRNMPNTNKYKIEVPSNQKLPVQKVTGISWDDLVEVIAKNDIFVAKIIRLHNVGVPKGTEHISGKEMLELWKAVERKKRIKPQPTPSSC